MASAVSYELFVSKQGAANGLATLDATSKIPVSQIPASVVSSYKGEYADSAALIAAYPLASVADYAYVTGTNSYWYWNDGLATPAWANQQIIESAYNALTSAAKAAMPYIVEPNA